MRAWTFAFPWLSLPASARCMGVLWLTWSTLLAADLHPRQMPRNPSSAKECAICHFRWVDTFFVDGRGTDLVSFQTGQVEGTSEMCFSCHDGSVLDSRWAFEKERGHRSGVPPRPGMIVPEFFPLDTNGMVQCVTCHTAHGVSSIPGETTSTFLRVNNTNSSICLMCHTTMAGNSAGTNHPLGQTTNSVPRELWSKHSKMETAAHLITCETCHIAHGDHQESLLRQPLVDSVLCLKCHADKSHVNPDGSRNFFHVINVVPTNAVIPAALMTNGARLARNGALTCLTCHKIHLNQIETNLLVAKIDRQSSFCLNCHTNQQGLTRTKHNLSQKFPDVRNLAGKTVAESGPCSACHLPHKNALSLAGGGDVISGLCLSCHGAGGIAVETNLLGRNHPVGVPVSTGKPFPPVAQPVSLPLFNAWRHPAPGGNMTCITCHDPHRPPVGDAPLVGEKFLRASVSALCQECHPHQVKVRSTKHDLSAQATVINNIQGQSPAISGVCSACHLVHSATASTWAQPGDSAQPSAKCATCHRSEGSAAKKIIQPHSHPVDVPLQKAGLTTTLPLDAGLAATNAPARMTCVTCHDPHRWDPSALTAVDPRIEGTARDSFLRLPVAPAPDLCVNCHTNEAPVVRSEHDLALFSPGATNGLGQTAADSGPCGVCHLSHNAPLKAVLWARDLKPLTPLTPVVDMMCRSCHYPQGVAASKVPVFSYHPPVTVIHLPASTNADSAFFPLFDPISGQQVSAGIIACSSCHNVHQWSQHPGSSGLGTSVEGDSNNSFLRHQSSELPCKICHGLDAIYRYQYYHKSTTHKAPDDAGLDDLFR
jgi:predicted CXXCH cytochrome family protein